MSVIKLSSLTDADAAAIRLWPPYPDSLHDLDYALRANGWLDQFPDSQQTRRFSAWDGAQLVGFSILTNITSTDAEFYIALHPQKIGHGIGRVVMLRTLDIGFTELNLEQIYLKVRDWHQRAIALYESIGFKKTGTSIVEIQGKPVNFVNMCIKRPDSTNR